MHRIHSTMAARQPKPQVSAPTQEQDPPQRIKDLLYRYGSTIQRQSALDVTEDTEIPFGYEVRSDHETSSEFPSITPGVSRYTPQHSQVSVLSGNISNLGAIEVPSRYEQSGYDLDQTDFASNLRKGSPSAAFDMPFDHSNTSIGQSSGQDLSYFMNDVEVLEASREQQYPGYSNKTEGSQYPTSAFPQEVFAFQPDIVFAPTVNGTEFPQGYDISSTTGPDRRHSSKRRRKEKYTQHIQEKAMENLVDYSVSMKHTTCSPTISPDDTWNVWNAEINNIYFNSPCFRTSARTFNRPYSDASLSSQALDIRSQSLPSSEDSIDPPPGNDPVGPPSQPPPEQ